MRFWQAVEKKTWTKRSIVDAREKITTTNSRMYYIELLPIESDKAKSHIRK